VLAIWMVPPLRHTDRGELRGQGGLAQRQTAVAALHRWPLESVAPRSGQPFQSGVLQEAAGSPLSRQDSPAWVCQPSIWSAWQWGRRWQLWRPPRRSGIWRPPGWCLRPSWAALCVGCRTVRKPFEPGATSRTVIFSCAGGKDPAIPGCCFMPWGEALLKPLTLVGLGCGSGRLGLSPVL